MPPSSLPKAAAPRPSRPARALALAFRAAADKKAQDPVLLDVRDMGGFTDAFLICHGLNPRQVEAIAEGIEEKLNQELGMRPAAREAGAEWRVLDYLDFVVHVFSPTAREFYALERLWHRAPRLAAPQPTSQGPERSPARASARRSPATARRAAGREAPAPAAVTLARAARATSAPAAQRPRAAGKTAQRRGAAPRRPRGGGR